MPGKKNKFKTFTAVLAEIVIPFAGVWAVPVYIFTLFKINSRFDEPAVIVMPLLFIPVIFFEMWMSCIFAGLRYKKFSLTGKLETWARILFWFLLYSYVIALSFFPDNYFWAFLNFPIGYFVSLLRAVYIAEIYNSIIFLILWAVIYYIVVVRKKKLRVFVSFVLPSILSYVLMAMFYFYGGLGEYPAYKISRQPGVNIFFLPEEFPKNDYFHHREWMKAVRHHPRDIYVDEKSNCVFAVYANTMIEDFKKVPGLLRIDMETKEVDYYADLFIRDISIRDGSVLLAPWFRKKIIELDKNSMDKIREIPLEGYLYEGRVREIYSDTVRGCVYIVYDMDSRVQKYDYETGALLSVSDPDVLKRYMTMELWLMQVSEKTGMLYLSPQGASNIDLIEIDPETMRLTRYLDLDIIEPCVLKLDDENQLIYCQDWGSNRLYEIDIPEFRVKRLLKGEVHSRKIHIDKERGCLYMLSYIYGTLSAVDLHTGKRYWKIKTGGKPYGMDSSGDVLFINSRTGIITVDLEEVWQGHEKNK